MTGRRIAVGKITKAHGIRGEVSLLPLSENAARFEPGSVLLLEGGSSLTIDRARRHQGGYLTSFTEVRDREAAQLLGGRYLFVDESDLPALPEGSFWPHEIEGCAVVTDDGRSLGAITEVLHTEANDVWVARSGDEETLIPALKEVVISVDTDAKKVTVRDVGRVAD